MEGKTFVQRFFDSVDRSKYKVYVNRDGLSAVDFGHKQLHERYLLKLYERAVTQNGELSTADFAELVPGRPCASPPFFDTMGRAHLAKLVAHHGKTRVYQLKV